MIHWPKKYPPSGMYRNNDAEKARMQTLIAELMADNMALEAALREIQSEFENNLFGYPGEMNRIARRALGYDNE